MSKEKEFESAIVKYPELIEEGLRLVGRQRFVEGRKFDLLFEDRKKNKLVAELKWGPIKDQHIGQIMFYAGCLISGQPVREVLVGTRVPPNIRAILDFHGIGWKQITATELREFLRAKGDEELAKKFDDEIEDVRVDAQPVDSSQPVITSGPAALFAPVEGKWLIKAREYFSTGKDFLYFFTRSRQIFGAAKVKLDIRHVYFKKKGETVVTTRGDFKHFIDKAPAPDERLPGGEADEYWSSAKGKFFCYAFSDLVSIAPIPLSELQYYGTKTILRNDVPGACIIKEPRACGAR